jgi:hypothetical protein
MDERIEAFMRDVLGLEGETSNEVREGVRRYMAKYEKTVRNAETDVPRKVRAAQQFRKLCRDRVLREIQRCSVPSTVEHLQIVLGVINQPGAFQIDR